MKSRGGGGADGLSVPCVYTVVVCRAIEGNGLLAAEKIHPCHPNQTRQTAQPSPKTAA